MFKKILFGIVLSGILACGVSVSAEYKMEIRKDISDSLQRFFEMEQGNRLTVYSMRGLIQEINQVFMNNIELPQKSKGPPMVKPGGELKEIE